MDAEMAGGVTGADEVITKREDKAYCTFLLLHYQLQAFILKRQKDNNSIGL